MRKLFFLLLMNSSLLAIAQSNLTTSIIEGGKTLVDLVRVFKTPKAALTSTPVQTLTPVDSCYSKGLADVTYKNTSGKTIQVSLYKRNGALYAAVPYTLQISNNNQETLYEIPVGIYKYKIEYIDEDEKKVVFKEGEIKINACDKLVNEIKKV